MITRLFVICFVFITLYIILRKDFDFWPISENSLINFYLKKLGVTKSACNYENIKDRVC